MDPNKALNYILKIKELSLFTKSGLMPTFILFWRGGEGWKWHERVHAFTFLTVPLIQCVPYFRYLKKQAQDSLWALRRSVKGSDTILLSIVISHPSSEETDIYGWFCFLSWKLWGQDNRLGDFTKGLNIQRSLKQGPKYNLGWRQPSALQNRTLHSFPSCSLSLLPKTCVLRLSWAVLPSRPCHSPLGDLAKTFRWTGKSV